MVKVFRKTYLDQISAQFRVHRIVALIGPRQCGKTTLAEQLKSKETHFDPANYFDLERRRDIERLKEVELAIAPLEGLIIIDEVQRMPELFASLRYIHDHFPKKRFLLLGSASKELLHQTSESLAGRIGYIEVTPFLGSEVHEYDTLWLRGGYPRSFLADTDWISYQWREDYIRTYLEQDLPALGIASTSEGIYRFWMMLTGYHGQIFNSSEIGKNLGISHVTAKHYLDVLTKTFMIRQMQPWYENIQKRQVKNPKIYIRDSGLLHTLLHISQKSELILSPKLGASWEGFALEQVLSTIPVEAHACYFWSTHNKTELDCLIFYKGKRLGFEFKYKDAPTLTKSMYIVMQDLKLDHLFIVYPGQIEYLLDKKITVLNLEKIPSCLSII
jgi:predicted AAA+ superfamily ATPase